MMIDEQTAREQVVTAADRLFYTRGIQAVGMDAVRAEAGVSLKRIYGLFPSKDDLVIAVLHRRTEQWNTGIATSAEGAKTPEEKLLAVFDFLSGWFRQDDFRGCAFINSYGELGASSAAVAQVARQQKADFQRYVASLVEELGAPSSLAPQLALLAEGAQTTAAISGDASAAAHARSAAQILIAAALGRVPAAA